MNLSNRVLNRIKAETGKHPSEVSFIVSTLHADSDRCTAGSASMIPSGLTATDVSLHRTVGAMKKSIQNRRKGEFHTSIQVISKSLAFWVLAVGKTTPEGYLFNLCVSLRLCFGLPKTKNARHSGFWALHDTASVCRFGIGCEGP